MIYAISHGFSFAEKPFIFCFRSSYPALRLLVKSQKRSKFNDMATKLNFHRLNLIIKFFKHRPLSAMFLYFLFVNLFLLKVLQYLAPKSTISICFYKGVLFKLKKRKNAIRRQCKFIHFFSDGNFKYFSKKFLILLTRMIFRAKIKTKRYTEFLNLLQSKLPL